MGRTMFISCYVFLLVYLSLLISCSARDTITSNLLSDERGETLVSAGSRFELGFFSTPSDEQRYLGIWHYGLSEETPIWVANRDKPLSSLRDGVLGIHDGNLKVKDGSGKEYWSTDLEPYRGYREAKLTDSGNLIFRDQQGQSVWQSFEHPTDTFLPGMKMDEKLVLTSWKSQDDPRKGSFTFIQEREITFIQERENRFVINKNNSNEPYWKSDLFYMEKIDKRIGYLLSNFSNDASRCTNSWSRNCSNEKSPELDYDNTRMVMNSSGQIQLWNLSEDHKAWLLLWWEPRDQCCVYNSCGDQGMCSNSSQLACECLSGYKPKYKEDWDKKNFLGGCVKKSERFCRNDTFLNLTNMRVGTPMEPSEAGNEAACKNKCLSSCGCKAYSYRGARRYAQMNCFIWNSIKNLQEYPANGAGEPVCLSVRVTPSDIGFTPWSCDPCGVSRDTITNTTSLSDRKEEILVSAGKRFELGFFSTPSHNQRYVGIWHYGLSGKTPIWVANRDKPLSPWRDGVLGIYDGDLKVKDGSGKVYWSTDLEQTPHNGSREAKLSDSGNLILRDRQGQSVWQSFEHPTDTFLPGMKMNGTLVLTSWKSQDGPRNESFTFIQESEITVIQERENRFVINKNNSNEPYWKSDLFYMEKIDKRIGYLLSNFSNGAYRCTNSRSRNCSNEKSPELDYDNTRMVMNSSGQIQLWNLSEDHKAWLLLWWEPRDQCSVYNSCGDLGMCSNSSQLACECLSGFKPKFKEDWDKKKFLGGCVKKSEGLCQNHTFLNLTDIRVQNPEEDYPEAGNETACKNYCLSSCPCQAYSYTGGRAKSGAQMNCFIWNSIKNLQEYPAYGGAGDLVNLSVRVTPSDIETSPIVQSGPPSRGEIRVSIAVGATIAGIIVISSTIVFIYILMRKRARKQEGEENINRTAEILYGTEKRLKDMISSEEFKEEDKKGIDVPFFDFESIIAATGNFSDANKLGQGGFGPVYKGTFPGGREMAIKRLSSVSGQGLEEFKNEVVLIAKLQHRNLVRLLGYCIKGDEKLLIYEYMRNRSLDFFIFEHGMVLNWEARFNIILGVARGLLYLHQDSRLRIIHRDLKTGNILLDDEMNPKISDFGLARIFQGKQTEGTTNRVIGTYGYMSPEYALDGLFSVKSDAFSFGVVLLEILSGKRNTGYFQAMHNTSLLGYAWRLWTEGLALDLMDEMVRESCDRSEFLKCVNVALLCVQDDPADRPTMSNVVVMLSSETSTLPNPTQPAFTVTRDVSQTTSSSKPEIVTSSKYSDSPRD